MLNSKGRNRLEGKLEVAIKHLKAFEKSPWKEIDGIFAVCRVALGGILMWKCAEFYFDRDVQMELFAVTGVDWFFPMAWAHIVILAHFMGAMCLFAGWATSFAAILQIPILVGAVLWVKLPTVLQVQQLTSIVDLNVAIMTLFLLMFFAIRGAGVYSLDYYTALDEEGGEENGHVYHPHSAH